MTAGTIDVYVPNFDEGVQLGAYTSGHIPFYLQTATATANLSSHHCTLSGLSDRTYHVTNTPQNTVWSVDVHSAASGNFRLRVNGTDSTFNQAFNVAAATLQSQLEGVPGIGVGNVTVSLNSGVYTITFIGALARKVVPLELLPGSPDLNVAGTATRTTKGTPGGDYVTRIQPPTS